MISYHYGWVNFEKEGEFIPFPGMKITFPKHIGIQEFEVNTNTDFFPEWNVEKNEVKVFLQDINTKDIELFRKRVKGLKKEGWAIVDVDGLDLNDLIPNKDNESNGECLAPDIVEYKNIQAKYDSEKKKAIFKIGDIEKKMSRRHFLVFKCLVLNAGGRVSERILEQFCISQGDPIKEGKSGLRVCVGRLRKDKDIDLDQFFVPLSSKGKGEGWILKAP